MDTETCTIPMSNPVGTAVATSVYPDDGGWHFVRAVHTADTLSICIDGRMTGSVAVFDGDLKTTFPTYNGQDLNWAPVGAFFNGALDDIRSLKTALPCGP